MKKQIEEMREDLIEIFTEEYDKRNLITADNTAEKMVAKGYRKQIEGEWVRGQYNNTRDCSVCGDSVTFKSKYCPNCGAKMKGGAE